MNSDHTCEIEVQIGLPSDNNADICAKYAIQQCSDCGKFACDSHLVICCDTILCVGCETFHKCEAKHASC